MLRLVLLVSFSCPFTCIHFLVEEICVDVLERRTSPSFSTLSSSPQPPAVPTLPCHLTLVWEAWCKQMRLFVAGGDHPLGQAGTSGPHPQTPEVWGPGTSAYLSHLW